MKLSADTLLRSRFTQLIFSEELEEAQRNDKLRRQRNPEPRLPQSFHDTRREIREHITGSICIGSGSFRDHSDDCAEDLRQHQRHRDMNPGEGLQEHHTEANSLQ